MSKRTWIWLRHYAGGCLIFLLCFAMLYRFSLREELVYIESAATPQNDTSPIIVLDAGHGGEDCGAVGVNGVYEKDINLNICTYLAAELRSAGCVVIETRTDDALLYDPATVEHGRKKVTDLANRLAIANSYPGAIVVSIHMNSFPQPSSRGLQVWYSAGEADASDLAELIQSRVKETFQTDNHRQPKQTCGSIFLLDRAENPSVLVECGFLTNPEECGKLSDEAYQRELSFVLFCAMMEYISQEK